MSEKKTDKSQTFHIDELDEEALEGVAGGTDINIPCTTKNTCNMVAGCGSAPSDSSVTQKRE